MLAISGLLLYTSPLLAVLVYSRHCRRGWQRIAGVGLLYTWLSISFWCAYAAGKVHG